MALVLVENDESLSGHEYDDRTGISYEYPKRYQKLIQPGVPFVYYRGRRRKTGSVQKQVYFGCGIVGSVTGPDRLGLMTCRILGYQAFSAPVYFRRITGEYWESRAISVGNHFRAGVRSIDDAEFAAIAEEGLRS